MKGMLKHKMLILQEMKLVKEIRAIRWYVCWETSKDCTGKPKVVSRCLTGKKPGSKEIFYGRGKGLPGFLFQKDLQLIHSLCNRHLFGRNA